jgi:hypothetical protein
MILNKPVYNSPYDFLKGSMFLLILNLKFIFGEEVKGIVRVFNSTREICEKYSQYLQLDLELFVHHKLSTNSGKYFNELRVYD